MLGAARRWVKEARGAAVTPEAPLRARPDRGACLRLTVLWHRRTGRAYTRPHVRSNPQ